MPKRKNVSLPSILLNKKGDYYCNWNRKRFYLGRSAERARENLLKLLTRADGVCTEPEISNEITVLELVEKFLCAWQNHTHFAKIRVVAKMLLPHFGRYSVSAFGPKCLAECRQRWVEENLTRNYINKLTQWIIRIFRWGVAQEIVPLEIVQRLELVEPLKEGVGRESMPRLDVADEDVLGTLPFLSETVRDMVILQRISGMRPSEVFRMTLEQFVKRDENVWVYVPFNHKTKQHSKTRVIAFGKYEIAILKKYADGKKTDEFLFQTRMKTQFNRYSYNANVQRAIQFANQAGGNVNHWTPYQLRHAAATFISLLMDENAVAVALGHASTRMTRIYDHSAVQKAVELVEKRDQLAGEKLENFLKLSDSPK